MNLSIWRANRVNNISSDGKFAFVDCHTKKPRATTCTASSFQRLSTRQNQRHMYENRIQSREAREGTHLEFRRCGSTCEHLSPANQHEVCIGWIVRAFQNLGSRGGLRELDESGGAGRKKKSRRRDRAKHREGIANVAFAVAIHSINDHAAIRPVTKDSSTNIVLY